MSRFHSHYDVVGVKDDMVFIVDLDDGGLSVTNDAEGVVADMFIMYGPKRVIYRDTMGNWDELVHEAGEFKGFAPYRKPVPFA